MRITVVIPTYNARDLLLSTLASLGRQTRPHAVVVVDNGSSDGTAEAVAAEFPEVGLLRLPENLGFGRAINRAAIGLEGGLLVLVNNDVVCEATFLERLCAPFADPAVGSVAGVLVQAGAPGRIDTAGIELDVTLGGWDYLWNEPVAVLERDPLREPAGPCAGAAAYRLDAFRQVGGFDEAFFAYLEDVELAIRLRLAGHRCVLAAGARGEHHHGATLGASSPRQRELHAFGRGYVLAKYGVRRGPASRLRVLLLDAPGLLVHLIVRREAAPIVARRRGLRAGRRNRSVERPPLELATVSLGGALARQWGLLALRLRGRLPAYYSESAGVADG